MALGGNTRSFEIGTHIIGERRLHVALSERQGEKGGVPKVGEPFSLTERAAFRTGSSLVCLMDRKPLEELLGKRPSDPLGLSRASTVSGFFIRSNTSEFFFDDTATGSEESDASSSGRASSRRIALAKQVLAEATHGYNASCLPDPKTNKCL